MKQILLRLFVLGGFWLSGGGPAFADCFSWNIANAVESEFSIARIKPGIERLYFMKADENSPDCPSFDRKCQLPSFLVPGDIVIVTKSIEKPPFACANYVSPKGVATTAFVDSRKLDFLNEPPGRIDSPAIYGKWVASSVNSALTIRPGGESFVIIEGEASTGGETPNYGVIAGAAFLLDEKTAGYSELARYQGEEEPSKFEPTVDGCLVRIRLIGPYLLVEDNDKCGGARVTFTALYAKAK